MSWVSTISTQVEKAFDLIRKPLVIIPALLMICELYKRPGLSAIALASAIIRRLPEAGINTGATNSGKPNKFCQAVRIMSEEIVKEIKDNARVTTVLEPGKVVSVGTGANAGGPVTIVSTNTMISQSLGLVE